MGRKEDGNREGENVLCPLFISFKDNEIRCQPHMPESSATIVRYASVSACRKQRKMFCEGCWDRCEHYLSWKHFNWEDD